jgi:hypothetical protein
MNVLKKMGKYFKCPAKIIVYLNQYKIGRLFTDGFYLKCLYKARTGKKLNLKTPRTFNEKLQWLKLHNRKDEFTTMVDKYSAKRYVAEKIGEEYIIPTLGVWERFEDVDFDQLPNQFVMKCTHDSGGLVICRDKNTFDMDGARKKINSSLKRNYYWHGREWQYKNVPPKILVEKYMEDEKNIGKSLDVYKILTFGGVPRIIQVIQNDKTAQEVIDYFDCDWKLLDLKQNYPNSTQPLKRPRNLEHMLDLSARMSQGFPFLRVDFYEINGKLYFSEFTFYSDSGTAAFSPPAWDDVLGSWIDLKG